MPPSYKQLAKDLGTQLKALHQTIPETMQGFETMTQAAWEGHALDPKTKELIAMAIAIASRCQGCLAFHAQSCVKLGITRHEFEEMIQVAVYMGGGPSLMTSIEALSAFEEFSA